MSYRPIALEEDLALKKVITDRFAAPADATNRFAWHESLQFNRDSVPEIRITSGEQENEFSSAVVARMVGSALHDLLLAREEREETIFSDINKTFVATVSEKVATALTATMSLSLLSSVAHLREREK